jgi:hypothetical protein
LYTSVLYVDEWSASVRALWVGKRLGYGCSGKEEKPTFDRESNCNFDMFQIKEYAFASVSESRDIFVIEGTSYRLDVQVLIPSENRVFHFATTSRPSLLSNGY